MWCGCGILKLVRSDLVSSAANAQSENAGELEDCLPGCRSSSPQGEQLTDCAKHTNAVTTLAWMPDGKHFVSGGLDKKIYMWVRGPILALHVLCFVCENALTCNTM